MRKRIMAQGALAPMAGNQMCPHAAMMHLLFSKLQTPFTADEVIQLDRRHRISQSFGFTVFLCSAR